MKNQLFTSVVADLDPTISGARVLVLAFGVMVIASTAFGQPVECTDEPTNALRLANCGFNSGIADWSIVWGDNATHNLVEGNPSPGSYQIDSVIDDEDDRDTTIRSACVPIAASSTYQIEGQFKLVDPLDEVYCELYGAGYSDDNCTSTPTGTTPHIETPVSGSEWISVSNTYLSQPDSSSMNIFSICYGDPGPTFTALMDNFIISGGFIFADGFESGDFSAWSSAVPQMEPLAILEFMAQCAFNFCVFNTGEEINFSFAVVGSPDFYEYDWNSSDGVFHSVVESSPTPITSHVYTVAGSYKPALRVTRGAELLVAADGNSSNLQIF